MLGGIMKEEIKKYYFIAKKDMGAYYLKPPLISWGLMLPIVFVFAFYFRNPTGNQRGCPRIDRFDPSLFMYVHGRHRDHL